jgi:hypothetical protein
LWLEVCEAVFEDWNNKTGQLNNPDYTRIIIFQDGQTSSPHSVNTQIISDDSAAHSPHSDVIDLDSLVNVDVDKDVNTS